MRKVLVAVLGACLLAVCMSTQVAHAQSVELCTNGAGSPTCTSYGTIQDAVNAAAEAEASDLIIKLTNGTYTEAGIAITETLSTKRLTIQGDLPQQTIIQADERACDTEGRVLRISGASVHLENLTIRHGCLQNGTVPLSGAGILSTGNLSLRRVVVTDNYIRYDGTTLTPTGGGIFSLGTLRIDSSSFLFNEVRTAGLRAFGGAIYSVGYTNIVNSTFGKNTVWSDLDHGDEDVIGGGIYNAGTLEGAYNTIVYNQSSGVGGGIGTEQQIDLKNTLFYANAAIKNPDLWCAASVQPCTQPPPLNIILGPLDRSYVVPVYRPQKGSQSIDIAVCIPGINTDQVGDARPSGNGCDLGSIEMGMAFLPRIIVSPPAPELRITAVRVKPEGRLDSTTPVVIEVVIENIGAATARRGFWVDLFINPRAVPPNAAGTVWTDLCRSTDCLNDKGIAWRVNTELYPGDMLTLTSRRMSDPFIVLANSRWNDFFAPGEVNMWAYVDSWNGRNVPWGWVEEVFETNNQARFPAFSVAQGAPRGPAASSMSDGAPDGLPSSAMPERYLGDQ